MMEKSEDIEKYRVMLSPLVYGAGIKGKITDSWNTGTPCITNYFGAEGLLEEKYCDSNDKNSDDSVIESINKLAGRYERSHLSFNISKWGGLYSNSDEALILSAYDLYSRKDVWQNKSETGKRILQKRFGFENNFQDLQMAIEKLLKSNREKNLLQSLLLNENNRATKYMSKYIEYKNKALSLQKL